MANDSSTVKITIDVVDANSGEVVSRITKNLSGMGTAGAAAGAQVAEGAKKSSAAMNEAGEAGQSAGKKISSGMDEAGAHTLTNLDKVRLLRDDLGIRIPRAMEQVIARSSVASAAIGAIGSGLVGLGAVEILVRMGVAAYELYKRLGDVNSEMQKYAVTAATTAQGKLFETGSIETMRSLVQQTNSELDRLRQKREQAGVGQDGSGSITQYGKYPLKAAGSWLSETTRDVEDAVIPDQMKDAGVSFAPKPVSATTYNANDEKHEVAAREQNDAAKERTRLLEQQTQVEKLQAQGAAKAAALVGQAAKKAQVDSNDAIALLRLQQAKADEQYRLQQSRDAIDLAKKSGKKDKDIPALYVPDPHAGEDTYREAVSQNHGMANAQNVAEARKQSEETERIQAEAREAGLRGEALYIDKRNEQLRRLKEQMRDTELSPLEYMKRVAAANAQYDADRQKRIDNENAETARKLAEDAAGGTTGVARMDADHQARLDQIAKQAPDFSNPETRGKLEAGENQRYSQDTQKAQQDFGQRLSQMDEGHADSSLSANARIEAETKKTVAEIEKAWQEEYGQLNALDQRRVQSRQATDAAIAKVEADAARQEQQARQKLLDETQKAEDAGRRSGLSKEQEQRQAILDEYTERYRRLEELRAQDAANADLYRRQEIAAEQEKDGKLAELQQQETDKLASKIKPFLTNPLEALKREGQEQAAKYTASMLMKMRGDGSTSQDGKHHSFFSGLGTSKPKPDTANAGAHSPEAGRTVGDMTVTATNVTLNASSVSGSSAASAGAPGVAGAAGAAGTAGAAGAAGVSGAAGMTATVTSTGNVSSVPGSPLPATASDSTAPAVAAADSGSSSSAVSTPFIGAGESVPSASNGYGVSSTSGGGYISSGTSTGGYIGSSSTAGVANAGGAPKSTMSQGQAGTSGAHAMTPSGGVAANAVNNGLKTGMADAQSIQSLGKQLFGPNGPSSPQVKAAMGSAGQALDKAAPAVAGATGMFSAIEGNGGFGGALQGAAAGAQLGSYFGPEGTAIGAGAGAVLGFIGIGGAGAADKYYSEQVKPHISNTVTQFGMGAMDYQSASDDLISLEAQARQDTKKFGMGGKREWDNQIHPAIMDAIKNLDREQKAGRTQYGMTAAQFHDGGLIGGFGSMATTGDQGFVHAQKGEFVMHQQAVPSHFQALQLMQSGASHADMAKYYGGSSSTAPAASQGGDNHFHFHTPDPSAAYNMFMDNKHSIRAALNSSYAENSGASD